MSHKKPKHMFEEYNSHYAAELRQSNSHFAHLCQKYDDLDRGIIEVEEGREHMDDFKLEELKKERLKVRDEAFGILVEYKKEKGIA